jgi:hypothetical protein
MFFGLLDPDPLLRGSDPDPYLQRIQVLQSSNKNSKKNLDSYCFVTSYNFLFKKNDINVLQKLIR